MNKYLIGVVLVLLTSLAILAKKHSRVVADRDRLSGNQRSLLNSIDYYKIADSLNAASVERLLLTKKELEQHKAKLADEVASLHIKLKRVQSASTSATEVSYVVKTVVKDSVVYLEGATDTLRCADYKDEYLTFKGCSSNGVFSAEIKSRDTLITIAHRVPRKFLFFRFGTKAIRQDVVSKNPYATVVFTEYVELVK